MNDRGERAETDFGGHGQGNLINHLPGVASDNRRPEDAVGAFPDMNFNESSFLTIDNGPVYLPQGNSKRVDVESLFLGVVWVHTDVSDLRVGIRAPGDGEGAEFFASEK